MEINERLKQDAEQVNQWLEVYTERLPAYGQLKDAMTYSLLSGGKRIRPILTLAVSRLLGTEAEKALPFACALEMVHTYSLIHDDLPCMDDDDFRRGKPTNHKVYGESTAVLAGDALLTQAFSVLSKAPCTPEQICRAVACLSHAAGAEGMVGGQVLDLIGEGKQLTYEQVIQIEALKTGRMIEAAARLGAIAADATQKEEEAVAAYAGKLGLAFQIRDDILDILGDEAELGKPVGSDRGNEKSTFAALIGIPACESLISALTEEAVACLDGFSDRAFLCEFAHFLASRRK